MTENIHALIQHFLQLKTVALLADPPPLPEDRYIKAGIVPFLRDAEGFRFYLMRPKGKLPALGQPQFQFGKGTRQHRADIGWQDIKEGKPIGEKETLAATALREGIEELGLKLANIGELYDIGGYRFSSATTGKPKDMWLFAAQMASPEDFAAAAQVADTTEERKWLSSAEFGIVGRPDQHYILRDIEARLIAHLK